VNSESEGGEDTIEGFDGQTAAMAQEVGDMRLLETGLAGELGASEESSVNTLLKVGPEGLL
jgi:hypothetical protein